MLPTKFDKRLKKINSTKNNANLIDKRDEKYRIASKGFKLQTLKAIELFIDCINKHGKYIKMCVAIEKLGDVFLKTDDELEISEIKNYSSSLLKK